MRILPALWLLLATSLAEAAGCSCFSPELQLKTARETLALASLAVYGRVTEVTPDGAATLQVAESFKGAPRGAVLTVAPSGAACTGKAVVAGQDVLLLAFGSAPDVCGTYEADHFLVPALRALPGLPAIAAPAASAP